VASTLALAEAGPGPITQDELERLLRESGVRVVIRELQDAPLLLQDWDLLEPADGGYRFRVELLRRWIAENKPLRRVQEELDRIEPVAENYYRAALGLYRSGQLDQAIDDLKRAIGLNPNHVGANQLLADILLAQGKALEATQLLEPLYEYQPAAARPRLVQALLAQARVAESDTGPRGMAWLWSPMEEDELLALYERVLELDPTQPEAVAGRRRIWQQRGDAAWEGDDLEAALEAYAMASLTDKVTEIEQKIRRRDLAARRLRELETLEEQRRYRDALDLAHKLADEYPGMQDWTSKVAEIEQEIRRRDLAARLQEFGALWDELGLGKWLTSTLTWLPFFIPTLALGTGTLPYAEETALSTACLWISLGLALAWVLTGWQGKSDDDFVAAVATVVPGIVAFAVMGFVMFIMINVAARALASDIEVSVAGITAGCVVISVAFAVAGIAASGVAHAMASRVAIAVAAAVAFVVVFTGAFVVVFGAVFIVAFPVALVMADLVAGGVALVAADLVAVVTRGVTVDMMGDAPVVVAGIIAFAVAIVVAFNLAIDKLAAVVADVGTMAAAGMSLLAHAFLVWFSFLGGWRMFQ
jgi:tetratricopeptide (TPR) repeat protein